MTPPRVARSLEALRSLSPKRSAVTLGVFDGVHRGHRRILDDLVRARRRRDVEQCYVVTFDPHPLVVTRSKMTPPMLTTIDERVALMGSFGLDGILVLPFDQALAQVDYRTFIEKYLLRPFDMSLLLLGYDCRFGRNREGSAETAAALSSRLGFEVAVVEPVRSDTEIVSSTKIRNALIEGDFAEAVRLLGHPYVLSGAVVRGHGKGRDLGFPTANLALSDPHKLWPPGGVYAVEVERGGRMHKGMMNVGRAPTLKDLAGDAKEVEVHIFGVDENLYGEWLRVYCHAYLREEQRFPSVEALRKQLLADKAQALDLLD